MAGHNGGPKSGTWFLSSAVLADHVERQLDQLGWDTAHIVGNSLGGWVAFELERRGRARTVTGIAPAGGWTRWTPAKFEVIAKFVSAMPFWAAGPCAGDARAASATHPPAVDAADQRDPGRCQRRTAGRHHRRRGALPGVLPAAGQIAHAARFGRVGADRRSRSPGALPERPGLSRATFAPLLPGSAAARDPHHRTRRRRAHPDVRGTGPGHRSDQRLSSRSTAPASTIAPPIHPPAKGGRSGLYLAAGGPDVARRSPERAPPTERSLPRRRCPAAA